MRDARYHLFLVLANAFWAGNFVVGGLIADSVSPLFLTMVRWVLATVPLFVLAALIEKPDWRAVFAEWRLHILLSCLGLTGYALFTYLALAHTSPVSASLLNSVGPALIAVVAVLLARERLSRTAVLGLALSLIGAVTVLARFDGGGIGLDLGVGTLFMLIAVSVFVVYTVLGRFLSSPPVSATAVQALIASAVLVPTTLVLGAPGPADGMTWLGIAFIGIFPSALSYLMWNLAVRGIGAARAGVYLNLVPFFTAIIGLVIGDPITWIQVLGGVLIVAGVVLTSRRPGAAHRTPPVPARSPD
ncbi:DMT family transporter [Brevibacterium ihuae]|uniref:DMT family transporter n=1 Tax=Brevibacterium ihuae TaxID=1631743 RepID=UPI000C787C90|nr:DMT family transporter [Brevibacterium ihuae]